MGTEAHSYTINVALNGRFLFRTEENNAANRNQVLAAIVEAFPAHEGYEVAIVDYPTRAGAYTIVHSPKDLLKPEKIEVPGRPVASSTDLTLEDFKADWSRLCIRYPDNMNSRIVAANQLIADHYSHIAIICQAWLDRK